MKVRQLYPFKRPSIETVLALVILVVTIVLHWKYWDLRGI